MSIATDWRAMQWQDVGYWDSWQMVLTHLGQCALGDVPRRFGNRLWCFEGGWWLHLGRRPELRADAFWPLTVWFAVLYPLRALWLWVYFGPLLGLVRWLHRHDVLVMPDCCVWDGWRDWVRYSRWGSKGRAELARRRQMENERLCREAYERGRRSVLDWMEAEAKAIEARHRNG